MRKYALFTILALATILRLVNLGSGDVTGSDEVFYSFRGIGMLDFDNAPKQTTPLEWNAPNIPWWTHLSFHDHPPLVFLAQNISMRIFGENTFGSRLPSAIFGIFAVYLLYKIAGLLFNQKTALIAAAISAVTVNSVYISRIGLQEGQLIFFMLVASYFFLLALKNDKYFLWTGTALGLGLLTKYNAFILVPIFLTYLLIFQRNAFKNKKFWLGALLSLIIFSPIIVYNLELYKTVGHLDFQFSYIFGQNPEVWQSAPGKEKVGDLAQRTLRFIPALIKSNSWLFLSIFGLSLSAIFRKKNVFAAIALFWLALLILRIGPTYRFLTILTPFMILSVGSFLNDLNERFFRNKAFLAKALFGAFLVFEALYSVNSEVLNYPIGPKTLAFSHLRYDQYNWGYNALDEYFEKELAGKMPALTFSLRYQFLEQIKKDVLAKDRLQNLQPYSALIVYDGNIHNSAQLWTFGRLQIYHAWPTLNAETYLAAPEKPQAAVNYFIRPTENIPLKIEQDQINTAGAILEQELLSRRIFPTLIYNKRGEDVFRVYKF